MTEFTKESELATAVMNWLTNDGWDCYPEVQLHSMGNRADIVAVYKERLVWIIEAKMNLSLAVLDQARRWLGRAHWISVAIPIPKRGTHTDAAYEYLAWKGIGVLTAQSSLGCQIYEKVPAPLHRKNFSLHVLKSLHPDMKRYTPGTQWGYSTPYRRTMDRVRDFIGKNPGCTIKEILAGINEHHYSSKATARSCIQTALGSFEKGIEVKQDGKAYRYFLTPTKS